MLKIPYIRQPEGSSCALACHTMVAQYFFPEVTQEEMAQIVHWRPGKVVWAFKFWQWLAERGIKIEDYDMIDYKAWVQDGVAGLQRSSSPEEFKFYVQKSENLDALRTEIAKILLYKNFTYRQIHPTFDNLSEAINQDKICEVVLNSRILNGQEGFSSHRIVVLGIDGEDIIFHDPGIKFGGPERAAPIDLFKKAWLGGLASPELCIYSKI